MAVLEYIINIQVLVLVFAAWLGVQLVVSYISYSRLSHIPGPWFARWSSLWLVGTIWRRQSHLEFYEIAKKYGPLARIGPNLLITSDPELLKRMSAARSSYTRSDWYLAFRLMPGIDNVFTMLDDKQHTKRRAQMHNGYLGKENITLEPTIDRNIVNLLDLIRRRYISKGSEIRPMDLAEKSQFVALDAILDIATGAPMGDLKYDKDVNCYLKTTAAALPPLIMVGSVPSVQSFLNIPFIAKRLFPTAEDEIGMGKLIGIAQKQVAERFSSSAGPGSAKMDMLQSFINHGLSQDEAVSESLIQILGGSDTTAGAIRTFMLYIITSPHVYSALQAEINRAVLEGKISSPVITDKEARELTYLQAVIKEGLRIFPPGTGLVAKKVPPEGDEINGVFLPAGTKVGVNMWALLRRKDVFGDDSDVFRPERWLEASFEGLQKMESVNELVWGYGKYVCLGKNVALIELNKIFVELLRNFDWKLVDPTKPMNISCYGIFVITDLWVIVTERSNESLK
ncbi:cytochrome P450 [Stipitochalara longipes BDJ]|nr:cytochrome P450 [Stipitochalara longipes BDJ]